MNSSSWADDTTDQVLNTPQVVFDKDNIKVIVEYKLDSEGKKIKITKKIQNKVIKQEVIKAVAERKKLHKFGAEQGKPPGPNSSTTTIGEQVYLKLSQWGDSKEEDTEEQSKLKESAVHKQIKCRLCKGAHFTSKCPYKDSLEPLEEANAAVDTASAAGRAMEGAQKSAYVPPHLRSNAKPTKDSFSDRSDGLPTIRITNLSKDTKDIDISSLCKPFGSISRIYLAKDRTTNECKGYSFVTYYDKSSAEKAIKKLHGFGFDNLILNAEWSGGS
ncbi:hypothetical protein BB561_000588 [Smittium simulii]|uniref:Eukaryotic translation initiation factor 3 subunit G n=1 Tax=Smittium simulii TaxID=133385 RepID=A0A2T9YYF3_9FUNG|nr:hypothetical protein BB561_000588 [Smittium simulii]